MHARKDCLRLEPQGRLQFSHSRAIDLNIWNLFNLVFRFQGKKEKSFLYVIENPEQKCYMKPLFIRKLKFSNSTKIIIEFYDNNINSDGKQGPQVIIIQNFQEFPNYVESNSLRKSYEPINIQRYT